MVNSSTEILILATPAPASAAVAGVAWWYKPGRAAVQAGRAAAISVGRAAAQRRIPAALAALISITVGSLAYVGRALEVSSGQALHGAVIAALASAIALGLYWFLGIVIRRLVTLFGVWVLSLMPLYFYVFLAWIMVARYTQCGPQAYECPL
ncbi:MAG TPA: hypothetical protein VFH80_14205 [Solirubrobacteraceae bacterium]|nr:hypothetical protein [Solirubrobacteraceae bacterium]